MDDNHQTQGIHKCSGCSKTIPTGKEMPCYTTDGIETIYNHLFCPMCKRFRGYEFSKPFYDPNLDLEKMKRIDTPEFKRYKENTHFTENVEKLNKELEEDFQGRLKKGKKIF